MSNKSLQKQLSEIDTSGFTLIDVHYKHTMFTFICNDFDMKEEMLKLFLLKKLPKYQVKNLRIIPYEE